MQFLTFVRGGERRALALDDVVAILDAPRLRRLPRVVESLAGIVDVTGRALAAVGTSGNVAIIVTAGTIEFALLVERVEDLVDDETPDRVLHPRAVLEELRQGC